MVGVVGMLGLVVRANECAEDHAMVGRNNYRMKGIEFIVTVREDDQLHPFM